MNSNVKKGKICDKSDEKSTLFIKNANSIKNVQERMKKLQF